MAKNNPPDNQRVADPSVRAAFLVLTLALAVACSSGPGPVDDASYEQGIMASRAQKDTYLRTDKDSPIPESARATFPGLTYYPIDSSYHVPAYLSEDRTGPPVIIELQMSQNDRQKMRRVGTLSFTLGEAAYKLTVFTEINDTSIAHLFLPFADLTSGGETYKGGRFLNLTRTRTGLYDLDFNQAYHPYCVYNSSWDCPVPPRENHLPVAIRAGERLAAPHS